MMTDEELIEFLRNEEADSLADDAPTVAGYYREAADAIERLTARAEQAERERDEARAALEAIRMYASDTPRAPDDIAWYREGMRVIRALTPPAT